MLIPAVHYQPITLPPVERPARPAAKVAGIGANQPYSADQHHEMAEMLYRQLLLQQSQPGDSTQSQPLPFRRSSAPDPAQTLPAAPRTRETGPQLAAYRQTPAMPNGSLFYAQA